VYIFTAEQVQNAGNSIVNSVVFVSLNSQHHDAKTRASLTSYCQTWTFEYSIHHSSHLRRGLLQCGWITSMCSAIFECLAIAIVYNLLNLSGSFIVGVLYGRPKSNEPCFNQHMPGCSWNGRMTLNERQNYICFTLKVTSFVHLRTFQRSLTGRQWVVHFKIND
jgi:hypothetical protein